MPTGDTLLLLLHFLDVVIQELARFDADIEGDEVRNQTFARELEVEQFGRQPEAVKEAENQRGRLGTRLEAEPSSERAEVVERFV